MWPLRAFHLKLQIRTRSMHYSDLDKHTVIYWNFRNIDTIGIV